MNFVPRTPFLRGQLCRNDAYIVDAIEYLRVSFAIKPLFENQKDKYLEFKHLKNLSRPNIDIVS